MHKHSFSSVCHTKAFLLMQNCKNNIHIHTQLFLISLNNVDMESGYYLHILLPGVFICTAIWWMSSYKWYCCHLTSLEPSQRANLLYFVANGNIRITLFWKKCITIRIILNVKLHNCWRWSLTMQPAYDFA